MRVVIVCVQMMGIHGTKMMWVTGVEMMGTHMVAAACSYEIEFLIRQLNRVVNFFHDTLLDCYWRRSLRHPLCSLRASVTDAIRINQTAHPGPQPTHRSSDNRSDSARG